MADWLVRQPGSEPVGPVSTELVVRGIQAGRVVPNALLCRVGTGVWRTLTEFPEFAGFVFDDAQTQQSDSPWFEEQSRAAPPRLPPPRSPQPSGLGLPAPAIPPTLASRGQGALPARQPLVAGQRGYGEVDDEAETRVAAPPSEAREFVDEETMTRVATGNRRAEPEPRRGGVLPTLPMPEVPDFQATRADVPRPRPAAGAPAPASRPREDVLPPTVPFIQAGSFPPPEAPAFPPPQDHYGYSAPPPVYGPPPEHYGHLAPRQQPYPPPTGGDQGLKALVGLIVFLAVALAIVLLLLFIRK